VARINNLTKEINADYRTKIPNAKLKTGEEEYQQVAERVRKANAQANLQDQEYARAQRGLAAALERNPNDAQAPYDMGRVLWAQGGAQNADQVLESFSNAIQLDPKMPGPWHDAGIVFDELRDVNRAAKAFERYLQLEPNAPDAPQINQFLQAVRQAQQAQPPQLP